MNAEQLVMVQQIASGPNPAFQDQARALLAGELNWSEQEIDQFIDGYMNDPYLIRNPHDRP